jgi:hypothetical protein
MKSKLMFEKLQDLNTMNAKQQKQFEKALAKELMKPEHLQALNEYIAKIKNFREIKDITNLKIKEYYENKNRS